MIAGAVYAETLKDFNTWPRGRNYTIVLSVVL
jgi:hypothetical protein